MIRRRARWNDVRRGVPGGRRFALLDGVGWLRVFMLRPGGTDGGPCAAFHEGLPKPAPGGECRGALCGFSEKTHRARPALRTAGVACGADSPGSCGFPVVFLRGGFRGGRDVLLPTACGRTSFRAFHTTMNNRVSRLFLSSQAVACPFRQFSGRLRPLFRPLPCGRPRCRRHRPR